MTAGCLGRSGTTKLALRDWFIGGEWLALNHLYIAAETLAPYVIARMLQRTGGR